jgi:hippurate hydrolase
MQVRDLLAERIPALLRHQAESFGCTAEVDYGVGITYPPCINDSAATKLVRDVAL